MSILVEVRWRVVIFFAFVKTNLALVREASVYY